MKKHNAVLRLSALLPTTCIAAVMIAFPASIPAQSSTKKSPASAQTPSSKAKEKPKAKSKNAAKDPSAGAEKAAGIVKALTPAQRTKLLDLLNKGETDALAALPGIGKTKAVAIEKARPFPSPEDLMKVEGIGLGTLKEIVKHAKGGFPSPKGGKAKGESKSKGKK